MTALLLAEKACSACGETKPLSEFHLSRSNKDGHRASCGACVRAEAKARGARRRAEMGEEAWLEANRVATAKARSKKAGRARSRASNAAYRAALHALRDAHRDQFDVLLARERYERGLT